MIEFVFKERRYIKKNAAISGRAVEAEESNVVVVFLACGSSYSSIDATVDRALRRSMLKVAAQPR